MYRPKHDLTYVYPKNSNKHTWNKQNSKQTNKLEKNQTNHTNLGELNDKLMSMQSQVFNACASKSVPTTGSRLQGGPQGGPN